MAQADQAEQTMPPFEAEPDAKGVREVFLTLLSLATRGKLQDRRMEACWHLLRGVTQTRDLARVMCIQPRTADGYLRDSRDFFQASTNEELVRKLWVLYQFAWGNPNLALVEKFGPQYQDLTLFEEAQGFFLNNELHLPHGYYRVRNFIKGLEGEAPKTLTVTETHPMPDILIS
jgi:hypothetical protein